MLKCDFNKVAATLLKSHFAMSVLLQICSIFSEQLSLRTRLGDFLYLIMSAKNVFS